MFRTHPPICLFCSVAVFTLMICGSLSAEAQEPRVAGRTWSEWSARVADPNPVLSQHAAHALSQFSSPKVAELSALCGNQNAVVRFWATRGLRRSAGADQAGTLARQEAFRKLASDSAASVRIEAAAGLATLGQAPAALEVLKTELKNPIDGARIMAINALDEMGDAAKPLHADIKSAQNDSTEYVKRIANRILARWNS